SGLALRGAAAPPRLQRAARLALRTRGGGRRANERGHRRERDVAHLPPRRRDMDGLVARRRRHLVIEEGLGTR
ncbi:MAG: hypothetical protein ACKVVP_12725, partial [Chloroflexota bacterium]